MCRKPRFPHKKAIINITNTFDKPNLLAIIPIMISIGFADITLYINNPVFKLKCVNNLFIIVSRPISRIL